MESNLHKLLVLCGPTGIGKTAVAVQLCEQLGGEIVGADSVQVYRGFDIGSAKPGPDELHGIAHHLLDVAEPDQPMDAAHYARLADAAIDDIAGRGKRPVVVGGTGLWLRALLRGLLELPAVDPQLRERLEQEWERHGAQSMHAHLHEVDPLAAAKVHPNDKRRVVRALEVHAQTGMALGQLRRDHALGAPRFAALTLWLDVEPAHHRNLLQQRTQRMIDAGFAQEVAALVERFGPDLRALRAVGYRQMLEHVQGRASLDEAREAMVSATQLYARRQRTWLNRDPSVDARLTPAQVLEASSLGRIGRHFDT